MKTIRSLLCAVLVVSALWSHGSVARADETTDYLDQIQQTQDYVDQIYQDQQNLNDYYNSLQQTQDYINNINAQNN